MMITVLKDFRKRFGPARNQGQRPTCTAFAASDTHAAARGNNFELLSAEFAFFHAHKAKPVFDPARGLLMQDILNSVESTGQPVEAGWPYLTQLPTDLNTYRPPAQSGAIYRRSKVIEQANIATLTTRLNEDRCVILGLEISIEFYRPSSNVSIKAPVDSPLVGRHAVIAVGHGVENGEQVFLIRNSWSETWGESGYAWISRHYLEPRIISLGAFEK